MASVAVPAGSSQPAILPTAVIDIPRPGVAAPVAPQPIAQPASQPILAANAADLAQAGYARLRAGQSAQAAALLDAALALQPGNRQWQADRAALGRRWQIGGFALLRNGSVANAEAGAAASPVLGGGQIGASIAVLADPYARRPLAMVVRANIAADPAGIRSETAQAAIGIRQAILPGVSISAERLIAAGNAARNDWTLRLAAGGARGRFSGYGEAGVLGGGQVYAGGQASAQVLRVGPAVLAAATWASVQTGNPDVWRVDIGPALGVQFKGVRVQADYRYRAGGNAAPGSGPALTVSAGY